MIKKILRICIIISCSLQLKAQRLPAAASRVSIRNANGVSVPFTISKEPKFRITNGFLSIAIPSSQNELLEITNIPIQYLKDTILSAKAFRAVLITSTTPFTSTLTDPDASVEIRCANFTQGERIVIYVNTPIYRNKAKYMVRATLRGKVPAQENNTTQ